MHLQSQQQRMHTYTHTHTIELRQVKASKAIQDLLNPQTKIHTHEEITILTYRPNRAKLIFSCICCGLRSLVTEYGQKGGAAVTFCACVLLALKKGGAVYKIVWWNIHCQLYFRKCNDLKKVNYKEKTAIVPSYCWCVYVSSSKKVGVAVSEIYSPCCSRRATPPLVCSSPPHRQCCSVRHCCGLQYLSAHGNMARLKIVLLFLVS